MQMIDVITKLREIAERSPEEIGRAIAAAEALNGRPVSEEMSDKQKKYFGGDKKDDDTDDSESEASGKKPDYLDFDKDGNKNEPMTKALADKEDKKVDEDISITLSGSDAVLAEILKLAGMIGAKTTKGPDMVTAPPAPNPTLGMPTPLPPLPALGSPGGPMGPSIADVPFGDMGGETMMDDAFSASTTPNPTTMGMAAAIPGGNDLSKPKITTPYSQPGTNPMHTAVSFD